MWVFTEIGFFSAVVDAIDEDQIIVRARVRTDLERLAEKLIYAKIQDTPGSDYPHRIRVSRDLWARYLHDAVYAMDYPNFKDQVAKTLGDDRESLYHHVWDLLQRLNPGHHRSWLKKLGLPWGPKTT